MNTILFLKSLSKLNSTYIFVYDSFVSENKGKQE